MDSLGTLRDVPVIAHTILTSIGHRESLLAAGFNGYIPKPVCADNFVGQIEEFLRSRTVAEAVH